MAQEPDAEWHTIRPWTRRFSMQIREVTSVSVTFILRSFMGASHSEAQAVLGSESDESDDVPTIADALKRGLAVSVNGNSWKRAVVHVDEDEEEALVIVYGLVPRKKYEICVGVAVSDEHMRETIVTQPTQEEPSAADMPVTQIHEDHTMDSATSPLTLTPPTTPVRSSPPRAITQEERVTQLRKQLTLLNVERDELAAQLKLARRESQRAETALKGEIDALRRASEKHAAGEHRSRQKVLALQEAVKQTGAAAVEIEEMAREMEAAMPGLRARAEEVEAEHGEAEREAEERATETETAVQADRKAIAELQVDVRAVCVRLEKVTGKHERLEKEVPQLEEKVIYLRREIGEMERGMRGEEDVVQQVNEESFGSRGARTWVPPIQRPSSQQRYTVTSFPPASFAETTPSSSPSRQNSFRSPRPMNTNVKRSSATLPQVLPSSYDSHFQAHGLVASEDALDASGHAPQVTSDLKSGSTVYTPPRFQTGASHDSPFSFLTQSADEEPPQYM